MIDCTHDFDTLALRATIRITYLYTAAEPGDGITPPYPEEAEIEAFDCMSVEFYDSDGKVWATLKAGQIRPELSDAIETRFESEVGEEEIQRLCIDHTTAEPY